MIKLICQKKSSLLFKFAQITTEDELLKSYHLGVFFLDSADRRIWTYMDLVLGLPDVQTWINYLTFLSFSFFISNMDIIIDLSCRILLP